jgi:hypothetical protein
MNNNLLDKKKILERQIKEYEKIEKLFPPKIFCEIK